MLCKSLILSTIFCSITITAGCDKSSENEATTPKIIASTKSVKKSIKEGFKPFEAIFNPKLDEVIHYRLDVVQKNTSNSQHNHYNHAMNKKEKTPSSQVLIDFKVLSHTDKETLLELRLVDITRHIKLVGMSFTIELSDEDKLVGEFDGGNVGLAPIMDLSSDNELFNIKKFYQQLAKEPFIVTLDNEGGFVKLVSPDFKKLDPALTKLKGDQYKECEYYIKEHLWIFNQDSLSKILTLMFPARNVQPVNKNDYWTSRYKLLNNQVKVPVKFKLLPIANDKILADNFIVIYEFKDSISPNSDFNPHGIDKNVNSTKKAGVLYKSELTNETKKDSEKINRTVVDTVRMLGKVKNWFIEGELIENTSVTTYSKEYRNTYSSNFESTVSIKRVNN